jgi:hypothetical protein
MAVDKSDPFGNLPRRSLFAPKAAVVPQAKPKPVVVPQKAAVVPRLKALVKSAGKRGEVKGQSIHLRLQPDEVAALDAWMAANGIATRPEAIRQLIKRGQS